MQSKRIVAVLTVCILSVLVISGISDVSAIEFTPNELNAGPYVDKIVYKVIESNEERVLALHAGEIEMDTSNLNPMYMGGLGWPPPEIDFVSVPRNGYGHISINCRDYPLNISAFRRAFAFAFDKTAVRVDIMDGFSQEHDSLVPYPNGWCVEDEFTSHYYTDQTAIGAQILVDADFTIDGGTGFLLAPNGEPFDVIIEYPASSPEIAGGTAQIGVDALHRLHINATSRIVDYIELIDRLNNHGEYDMLMHGTSFENTDVDWLAYEFWSEYADVEYQNPTNFVNTTYDSWRDQLLYGTTYEEVFEASAEMQKILQYNVPRLVVYENTYIYAYRNDQFTGHVADLANGISGPWTMRKIQKKDGTFGGTVPVAISQEPDSFNIYTAESPSSKAILNNLYSSLFNYGPDLKPIPDLAESMTVEIHADNLNVPEGHTRFTIDIIQDAMWSDGTDLTAEDVVFSIIYAIESADYGNPAGSDIADDLAAAYAPSLYAAVIEFNTESYWHFSDFAYDYIIPKHIFNDDTGIGFDNWDTWNPVFDPAEPHITYGPYILTDYEAGEFYELTYNPHFYYASREFIFGFDAPWISPPSDITYELGSTGNEIVWTVFDYQPNSYSIQMNGIEIETGQLGVKITHNIDGLDIGNYTFTLNATDDWGLSSNDSVLVMVVESTGTSSSPPQITSLIVLVTSISLVSVVIILASAISIYRKKQTLGAG